MKMFRTADRRAIPFVPMLGICSFFIYLTFFITTGLNVSNSQNGWAAGIYSLGWLTFGSMSIFYFLKMLRLGKKLIPLSKHISSIPARLEIKDEELGNFDAVGRILFIIEVLSVNIQWILLFLVGIFVSHNFDIVLGGCAILALFLSVHALSVLWLIKRTISAIKKSRFKSDLGSSSTDGTRVRNTIRKMREQVRKFNVYWVTVS